MQRFTLPRDMYHGKGALEALKTLEGKKQSFVSAEVPCARRFLDRAVAYLKEAGMEVRLFEGIESDPSVETVMRGADEMLAFEPDWIVAMGGGSPSMRQKHVDQIRVSGNYIEDMCKVSVYRASQKAQFCAISSTSGTQQRLPHSPSSQIIKRVLNIRLRILRLHRM